MIAPELHTCDLEADGFAWLGELASALLHRAVDEVQVLHRDGTVLNVVRARVGHLRGPHPAVVDPHLFASRIHAATGAERVTLIDADGLDDLARAIDAEATGDVTQVALMARATQLWHTHPAVVSDPPLSAPRSPRVATALAAASAGAWAVIGAWRGDALFASLLARFGADGVDLFTSADHVGLRPARNQAVALVDAVAALGPVTYALLGDADDLEAAARAEDPWAALEALVHDGRLLHHHGIEALLQV